MRGVLYGFSVWIGEEVRGRGEGGGSRPHTMSTALKLAVGGEAGRGNDALMVKRSMFPSSLESTRATLMLGSTVVAGNRCDAATPEEAKYVGPDSSWRKKRLLPSKSTRACSKWELSLTHKSSVPYAMRNAKMMLQQKTTNRKAKGHDNSDATYFVTMGSFHMTTGMESERDRTKVDVRM